MKDELSDNLQSSEEMSQISPKYQIKRLKIQQLHLQSDNSESVLNFIAYVSYSALQERNENLRAKVKKIVDNFMFCNVLLLC